MAKLFDCTLTNRHGCSMRVTNFGGRVMSLFVPDRNGSLEDVVLGYDTPQEYAKGNPYFGSLIGRFGNRLASGKFSLDGKYYQLPTNDHSNCLHGGPIGFHNIVWDVPHQSNNELKLQYLSPDGEAGFPGNLLCQVTYQLTDANELKIDYHATTDASTIINLTHHSFFNLKGEGDILNHQLMINGNQFCPVNESLIPTGQLQPVRNTPFDFTKPTVIGSRINQDDIQLRMGNGYDHCWVLNKDQVLSLAAQTFEPQSGRTMEVWTTEPGLQFYSGNFLNGKEGGKQGKQYAFRSGFCLEAQHFPDSPNHPNFPSTVLRPRETYRQQTIYKFGIY